MKYVLLIMILLVGCSTPTLSMTISSEEEYNALGMFDYEGNILKWEKDYLNKELVLFCAAGGRSALAAKTLKEMGFNNVSHVEGGFGLMMQKGFKIKP